MSKTYGQQFDEAMACITKAEAQAWMEAEIARYEREFGKTALGYMTGYYDRATAMKVKELFGAVHPIFGGAVVDAKTAYEMGRKLCNQV
jgi:hypothetical protein